MLFRSERRSAGLGPNTRTHPGETADKMYARTRKPKTHINPKHTHAHVDREVLTTSKVCNISEREIQMYFQYVSLQRKNVLVINKILTFLNFLA